MGAGTRRAAFVFHARLMTEAAVKVQQYSAVAGLPMIINNTCMKKHQKKPSFLKLSPTRTNTHFPIPSRRDSVYC
jgi:hypothetical protein